jgi:diguanylate cyclase (GGDEF)-like protein
MEYRQEKPDLVVSVAILTISILVGSLCVYAAQDNRAREVMPILIIGLTAGGLILYRQLRKAHGRLLASEARAQYRASHDDLTGLPNRTLFTERVRHAVEARAGKPAATVIAVSLERLDELDEGLGDGAADQAVREIAERFGRLDVGTSVLARVGDAEFALLRECADEAAARGAAAAMLAALKPALELESGPAFVGGSIGLAFTDCETDTAAELIRRAKLALAEAHRQGVGAVTAFEPHMDGALQRRREMESDLRQAIAEGSLDLVYQPQATAKGEIFGAEALMRWRHPEHGEVPPSVFIPLAEACGLGEDLERFALRRAFSDAGRWPTLTIAINISATQIRSGRIVETLIGLLAETKAAPNRFELEITESILLDDEPRTLATLMAIRRLGFKIALDDFGTGYSSLSYLRRFPVDKIKIDRSFVTQLGVRRESDAIVKAIVELADALDMKVIAEGVETPDQLARLITAGCRQVQGFLYGEPTDPKGVDQLLRNAAKAA